MLVLDKNNIKGDDRHVCGYNKPDGLSYFVADCEEMTCECCTKCCTDAEPQCNQLEMAANLDDGYSRDKYVFSEDLKFTATMAEVQEVQGVQDSQGVDGTEP